MRQVATICLVAAIIAVPAASLAQRAETIQRGAMVRVSTPGKPSVIGYLDSLTMETLALRVTKRDAVEESLSIARGRVTRLDVRGRSHLRGALRGAGLGFLSGAISGFILGAVTHRDEENCWMICSRVESGMLVGLVGAVIATPIGIVGGAAYGAGKWRRVHPATATIQ